MNNAGEVRRRPSGRGLFPYQASYSLHFLFTLFSILMLLAVPQVSHSAQITIAWDGNAEPEVSGYRLHHGSSSGTYGSYTDVGSQTACTLSGLQAGSTYFFAATAYDAYGNQSNYSTEITFSLPSLNQNQSMTFDLQAGWNLLSLPFQLANPSIPVVLAPIAGKYSIVWGYRNGQWVWYVPGESGSTLQAIDAGSAYWVKMTSPAPLPVAGGSGTKRVNVTAGWNFVGYSESQAAPLSTLLASISGNYSMVWSYESGGWKYHDPSDPDGSSLTQMQPGRGYWIKMREGAIWTLP